MPCKPGNSPTERIGDLLAEIEDFVRYADEIRDGLERLVGPDNIIARPVLLAFEKEKVRRQYTLRVTQQTKLAQRRSRSRNGVVRAREELGGISDDVKRQIEELIEEGEV